MIKVEQGLLVVDSTLSKEDVEAINQYVALAEKRERDRITLIVKKLEYHGTTHSESCLWRHTMAQDIVDAIDGKLDV